MENKNRSKPKITETIIKSILIGGGIAIAMTDPKFGYKILPKLLKYAKYKFKNKKEQKKFYDTFSYLKKRGYIKIEKRGRQVYVSLTEDGRKKAGKYQIDDLEIKKPARWDGKWRILIFDIENKSNIKREALRGKIKELGLFQLQKSVWVYPYDFSEEIRLLREFFGLSSREMQFIVALKIEDDLEAKFFFKLKAK